MKTKAAVLVEIGAPLEIWELGVPSLGRGQVLVKVLAAGVCRTQVNEVRGLKGPDRYIPHLLGHEGAGVVHSVGPGVTTVLPGDFVILSWIKGIGLDGDKILYKDNGKQVNAGPVAIFSQYAVVAENRVTQVRDDVPPEVAAVVGCALATGVGVVRHDLQVNASSILAVFGVGGVGLAAIMGATLLGCKRIVAVDVSERALTLAGELGATDTIHASDKDPIQEILNRIPGGVTHAIDASGVPSVIEQAFQSLSTTGTLAIAGHPVHGSTINFDPFAFIQGRKVIGTWGGATNPAQDFPEYLKWYKQGRLPIEKLLTRTYPLEDINRALEDLEQGSIGRGVITMIER